MTRSQRLLLLVITVLPLLILIFAGAIYLKRQLNLVTRGANVIIAGELQRRFGKQVHVGAARVSTPGRATLEDVKVSKTATFAGGTLVSARRIVVHYDWRALLFGGKGAGAVSRVDVNGPRAELIRRADGTFNITELLKPPPGPLKPPFRGRIIVTGGDAEFVDYAVIPGRRQPPILFRDLAGAINAARYPIYSFSGSTRGSAGQFARALVHGDYDSRTKRVLVDVNARNVSAPMVVPYALKSKDAKVSGGNLDLVARVDETTTNGQYRVRVAGTVKVHNATVGLSFLKAPVTGVNGELVLTPDRAAANLSANLRGTPAHIAGTLADFRNPTVNLVIVSRDASFQSLIASTTFLGALSQFSPKGRGPAYAKITGSLRDPTVDVTASIPRASIRGVPVSSVRVSALYRHGRVDLHSVQLIAKGASFLAAGYANIGPPASISLRGRFSNFNLKMAPVRAGLPITGIASGSFTLTGSTDNPTASVALHVTNGLVSGTRFSTADADVQIIGSRAKVNRLQVTGVAGGSVSATGDVSSKSLNLTVSAEGISIADVARYLGETGYSGTAFFTGRVSGTPEAPKVYGSIEVFDAKVNEYTIDHVLVAFAGDRHAAVIGEGLIQVYPAEMRFSGDLSGLDTNRIAFAGKGNVQRLELTKLLDLLDRHIDVTGTILGDITFSGSFLTRAARGAQRFAGVTASGSLSLEDAAAFGYPVTAASAKLEYANDLLKVSDAVVASDNTRLALSGTMDTGTHAVNGRFDLTGFDLSRLHEYLGDYLVVAGTAAASGTAAGTWDDIKASASVKADGLAINYERFDQAEAQVTYSAGKFATYSASLARGSQRFDLSGTDFDPETVCLTSAKGVITDVSVPDIWDIVRASPYFSVPEDSPTALMLRRLPKVTAGRINGTFEIRRCLDAPDGSIDLTATNVGLDVERIESIDLQASAKSGVITLSTLKAVSEDMSLEVTGDPAYEKGNLNLEVKAENVRLSRLEPLLGERTPGGTLSALFTVRGPAGAPEIIGSAEVVKPSYGKLVFDQLRASTILLTPTTVEIPDILITSAGHQAKASASLPWDWSSYSVPKDEPVSASIDLGTQSFTVLNTLGLILSIPDPIVDAAKTTGVISEAWFRLDGTLMDPQLTGSVKAANGTVAFIGFANTFNNVNVDMAFAGNRLVVSTLSAVSSLGGSIQVVPGGYVIPGLLGSSAIDLQVAANRLMVAERNLLGLREDVNTQIDMGLSIAGLLATPTVADKPIAGIPGGITVSHGRLAFQLAAKNKQWPVLAAFNPTFDLSIRLGQDVVVAPPNMTLSVTGGGTLTGTLSQPVVKRLGLDVLSGEIALATARLRLIPGGTIYISYAPPAAPDVQIDLRATASVFAVNSLNKRLRYQITMAMFGQAATPQISLSSSPPGLTREQMLAGLGHLPSLFASPEAGLQNEIGSVLTAAGATALFAPIENIFITKLGFEQFSLEFSPIYPLSLYASRHLFGSFYIGFSRQLRSALASTQNVWYTVTFSYRKGLYDYSISCDDEQTLSALISYSKAFW